jgi:DNA recombination protein RmuC
MKSLGAAGESLRLETLKLSRALSKPEVRGRYGEIQLRRVAELAGMMEHCDFNEQQSQRDGDGRLLRPDMTVSYPNGRMIAVDAKCNILAYIEAIDAPTEESREACLERFADHVAAQAAALGRKTYWSEFEGSPEFVVMFVPGDQFIDAALSRRRDLIERAAEQGVILASPSMLIGLLRAVYVGWREKRVEDQARELIALGRELHERASIAFGHVADLGAALESASKRYNAFVASYESRLEPTLRKFEDAGVKSSKDRPALTPLSLRVRDVSGRNGVQPAEDARADDPPAALPQSTSSNLSVDEEVDR